MKSKLDTVNLCRCETAFEMPTECSLEADISMPDYCPEIKKILKSSIHINHVSVQNSSSSINLQADALVRIVYIGDNGQLSGYEQVCQIQKSVDAAVSSDCIVTANISTDYINTRAVNQRKVDVRAMMTVKFKAVRRRNEEILCSAQGAGIQTKRNSCTFASVTGMSEKVFSLTETVEVDKNKGSVMRIINASSYVCINDTKIINNKALVKGNCQIVIYYISEKDCNVECAEYSLPISQIVETEGVNENSRINLCVEICSCETVSRVDAAGEMRLIDLNLKLRAVITAFEDKEISLIRDCYSTDYEIKSDAKKLEILEYNESFDSSFLNKVVLESIGVSVNSVLGVWCSDLKYNFSLADKKCLLSGTYQATVIYLDSDKQLGLIQKPVEFENALNLKNTADRIVSLGNAQLLGCSCSATGDSRLELKTEISVNCTVLSSKTVDYVSTLEVDESREKTLGSCALTIYYCDSGENLWNIARRYNTTVEAIKNENNLIDETVPEASMLLIPSV